MIDDAFGVSAYVIISKHELWWWVLQFGKLGVKTLGVGPNIVHGAFLFFDHPFYLHHDLLEMLVEETGGSIAALAVGPVAQLDSGMDTKGETGECDYVIPFGKGFHILPVHTDKGLPETRVGDEEFVLLPDGAAKLGKDVVLGFKELAVTTGDVLVLGCRTVEAFAEETAVSKSIGFELKFQIPLCHARHHRVKIEFGRRRECCCFVG